MQWQRGTAQDMRTAVEASGHFFTYGFVKLGQYGYDKISFAKLSR